MRFRLTKAAAATRQAAGMPDMMTRLAGSVTSTAVIAQAAVKAYETDAINKPQAETALAQIQARFGDHDAAIAALPHLLDFDTLHTNSMYFTY